MKKNGRESYEKKNLKTIGISSGVLILFLCCNFFLNQFDPGLTRDTVFEVLIHDKPFRFSGKTVEALNISVVRMDIIRSKDQGSITLLDKPVSMDILKIQANDPVVLSSVSVEPGRYEQLRLVLSSENTITVDGETFPLKIPSGEQTGVKALRKNNLAFFAQ